MATALHITDVFFHAEIARIFDRKAGDEWLTEQLRSSISPTQAASEKSCGVGAKRAWHESERNESSFNTPPLADQTLEYESVLRSDIEIDEELGDLVGLLFTDAAHAILPLMKCRQVNNT